MTCIVIPAYCGVCISFQSSRHYPKSHIRSFLLDSRERFMFPIFISYQKPSLNKSLLTSVFIHKPFSALASIHLLSTPWQEKPQETPPFASMSPVMKLSPIVIGSLPTPWIQLNISLVPCPQRNLSRCRCSFVPTLSPSSLTLLLRLTGLERIRFDFNTTLLKLA